MSGGHYDYNQHYIWDIAETIVKDLANNSQEYEDEEENEYARYMPSDVVARMTELKNKLEQVAKLANLADWLYSGDTSEEYFCEQYDKIIRGED